MRRNVCLAILFLFGTCCSAEDEPSRPVFPDVFQTEFQGMFIKDFDHIEMDGGLYYDRINNRVAFHFTFQGQITKNIYHFNRDELISFDGDDCNVDTIPDDPKDTFISFSLDEKGKKIISAPEEIMYFSKSELRVKEYTPIPSLVYAGIVDIPYFGRSNCSVNHTFSRTDLQLPNCEDGQVCEPTLMNIGVRCKDENEEFVIDHFYNFFRFRSGPLDESIFLPPAGVFCNLNNTKKMPAFSPYFSFSFDVVEKIIEAENDTVVFSIHKEVWYDMEKSIVRLDEYGGNGLLSSSKIADVASATEFVIIPIVSSCKPWPIPGAKDFTTFTSLPKVFFDNKTAESAVYVGKRMIYGITYDVWSIAQDVSTTAYKVVEEIYFLELLKESQLSKKPEDTLLRISHIDKYTYQMRTRLDRYDLAAIERTFINNYRTYPKEWDAFDVATCFDHTQKKNFLMKLKGPNLIKEGHAYHEVLESLYNKITAVTGVSLLRISELRGVFDGNELIGARGSILDNTNISGWQNNKQQGMDVIFKMLQRAAKGGKLSVTYKDPYEKENTFIVTSVEDADEKEPGFIKPGNKPVQYGHESNSVNADEPPRPVFPDVFQTEVQGIFIKENEIAEMEGDLYYDRNNNRAAFQLTYQGETSRIIYDFNSNEMITFDGANCEVPEIPDDPNDSFFSFSMDKNGKKKIAAPEDILFFSKSELLTQEYSIIPTLVYSGKTDIPSYRRKNCDVMHVFSKPDIELANCNGNLLCESVLMTVSVKCKDENNDIEVDHVYNFFRFKSGTVDESIFRPPPGVFCNLKNTRKFPLFPPYFSISFDVVRKVKEYENFTSVFSTHKEVWYDEVNSIARIDEYSEDGLLVSSRILDVTAATAFVIIPIVSSCSILPILGETDFSQNTGLSKVFFDNETSEAAVYVGKRMIYELTYDVWSLTWDVPMSGAKIVEEIYFLELVPESQLPSENPKKTVLQISHIDRYTSEIKDRPDRYDLTVFQRISINNYRTTPKEWDAFDVATCFDHTQKKDFVMKLEGSNLIKEGLAYHKVLESLYNKIIAVTGISVLRISELSGVFDGKQLTSAKGSILENTNISGWKKDKQPGMDEIFNILKKAASEGKLSITYKITYSTESNVTVTSVKDVEPPKTTETKSSGYSGASMAAASIVLLVIGISFGIAGYYVFLKKRRPSNNDLLMKNMESKD